MPHPVRCFTDPVRLRTPLEQHALGLTYIKATADGRDVPGGQALWDAAEYARRSDRWRHYEIDTNHMVASDRPDQLVEILLGLGDVTRNL